MTYNQVALIILDGWGYSEDTKYNAIASSNPQFFNHLWQTYPHTLLPASGEAVGLPKGTIGTSEIGHSIIGAGSIIETDIVRINKAVTDGTLKNNPALSQLFKQIKEKKSTLHLLGLVSPGGVHSHQDHLYSLLKLAKEENIQNVVVHAITDGRDTGPQSGVMYLEQLENFLAGAHLGIIGSVSGRYFAMDRDENWDRIEKMLPVLFTNVVSATSQKASEVLKKSYEAGVGDEFLEPTKLQDNVGKIHIISENDGVLFFNFRQDRARELSLKIAEMVEKLHLCFVTMTEYDKSIKSLVAFPSEIIETNLATEISKAGLTQIHIAETEKYAHVTYFMNGWSEKEHDKEKFVLIPSRKDVPTHDLAPEMRAKEIADKAIEAIDAEVNLIILNFANADMVGHTGKWDATVTAVAFEDTQIKRVVEELLKNGGVALVTADHGNAEKMFDDTTNQPYTAHTLNPVPAILTLNGGKLSEGTLADIAPTILTLLGLQIPHEMSGKNLYSSE